MSGHTARYWTLLGAAAAILIAMPHAATASAGGGGGGGGMPSMDAPRYDPTVEYRNGITALKAGDYKTAERSFDHVLDVAPDNAPTLFLMGLAQSGQGNFRGAQRSYTHSLRTDPKQIAVRRELALTWIKLGQPDKARAELATLQTRATACANTCPDAADLQAAIDAINAGLAPPAAAPPAAPSAAAPGAAPAGAPPGKTPISLLLTDPADGDHAYVDAVRLVNSGKFEDAITALRGAQTAFGPHPDILTYIGYANRRLGRYDIAESYYRQALAIAPNHRGATEYYGELMVERGDIAGARRMLAKLETQCRFGCAEVEDLRRWIDHRGSPQS
jgi:Flp pilus assembly protein TadD